MVRAIISWKDLDNSPLARGDSVSPLSKAGSTSEREHVAPEVPGRPSIETRGPDKREEEHIRISAKTRRRTRAPRKSRKRSSQRSKRINKRKGRNRSREGRRTSNRKRRQKRRSRRRNRRGRRSLTDDY